MNGAPPSQTDAEKRLGLYRAMLRIRIVEEWIADHYGEQEMRCPVHLSIGQEAIAVGVCDQLRRADKVVSNHRAHAHYLAKGGDLRAMMAEIYGKAAGTCGGRGGSMHLFDDDAGLLLSLPIVGSSIPIGVGAALAFRQEEKDNVAVVFFGDGAIEEGVFHESANFAALKSLPVIFVCENNLYSVYTPLDQRQPSRPITDLAKSHAIPVVHGDGNDVTAVAHETAEAIARARQGKGPSFLLFDTYRWREHCGPNYDDDIGYRTPKEAARWRECCPVGRLYRDLVADGTLSEEEHAALVAEIEGETGDAISFARSAPFPDPSTVMDHIYAG